MLCTVFTACLDIPAEPSADGKITGVSILILQDGSEDSTTLKINTSLDATLKAVVHPSSSNKNLKFQWFRNNEELGDEATYSDDFLDERNVPNRLIVSDREGNTLEKTFTIITNSPPQIGSNIEPADSAIIQREISQPITFDWYVTDVDNDDLVSNIVIDDVQYNVGSLTQISQSGFDAGWHFFYIFVEDSKGDKAFSEIRHFFVSNPEDE